MSNVLISRMFNLTIAGLLGITGSATALADWPYWRGPRFDGTAEATGLPEQWDPKGGQGSNLLWENQEMGGPCTPIVMNGRLYTIQRSEPGTAREGEKIVCLDATTGKFIWETKYNVWLSDVPAERIGWSSVVGDEETGNVYALGSCDIFQCLHGETGEVIWSNPLHEQFGMLSTYGGRTNFPVIHEDLVIISGVIINWGEAARPNHRLIGMDKRTGKVVWFSGTRDLPDDTTYSAPSIVTIEGQRQLILGTGDGAIWGFQPRTGKPLWHYELSMRGVFAAPLVVGNRVFASTSEENIAPNENVMGSVAAIRITGTGDQTKATELWKQLGVVVGRSEPVLIENRLYVVDDRCKMWIFDAETGESIVERKSFSGNEQNAALLHADGKIYVLSREGWAVLKPTADGFEVLSKGRLRNGSFIASPIVADGRLYFQSTESLFCVSTEQGNQRPIQIRESMGEEAPVAENPKVAQLQVVPAEALVTPGEQLELSTNFFNAIGQRLEASEKVTYEVDGPGSIQGSTFTASSDQAPHAVTITASAGDVIGKTRFRIVPPLPWKFTFDDLKEPPVTWVGARYRNVIRPIDGSPALTKVTTIPKGTRSTSFMGPSDLKEYTISADARGARMSQQLPDIGLIAQGYLLDLMGQQQRLEIRTWNAQKRLAQQKINAENGEREFPWKEDTWYRMKLRVDIESEPPAGVTLIRGKVWPRDEPEPMEWTVTARDESPNLSGSPGLYGNAKVAEIYMDNIEVIANPKE